MPDLLSEVKPDTSPEVVGVGHEQTSVEADKEAYEQRPESKEHFLEETQEDAPVSPVVVQPKKIVSARPVAKKAQDPVTLHVEQILEKDLGELYASLPDNAKPIFKQKGEEVSTQISTMVQTFRVEAARVVRLIRDWLLTIPNVNKHFLEQEAKIKTDAILEFDRARREDLPKRP